MNERMKGRKNEEGRLEYFYLSTGRSVGKLFDYMIYIYTST